jgi:fatty acid desaturase
VVANLSLILSQIMIVILIGVYAIRAASVFFVRERFQPLMIVAALAFVFALVLFHLPPTQTGAWLYLVIAACLVGVAVNALLYFKPDQAHSRPTDLAFSAVSCVGWGVLAGVYSILI